MEQEETKSLRICRLFRRKRVSNKVIYELIEIDQCIDLDEGNVFLLTGEFSGGSAPILGSKEEEDSEICVWPNDISYIQEFIPITNIDDMREIMEDLLLDTVFVKYDDKEGLYLIEEEEIKKEFLKVFLLDSKKEPRKETKEEKKKVKQEEQEDKDDILDVLKIIEAIKKTVISQDEAIRKIVTAICGNQLILSSGELTNEEKFQGKKNILVVGKTGTGKTEIIRQLSKILDLPYVIADANEYTVNGYKGKDVETILTRLLTAANGNYQKAKNGIIVIDEIDKLAPSDDTSKIATTGVQQALLKMIEGTDVLLLDKDDRETVAFDTRGLTFILTGAFSEIFEQKSKISSKIGFSTGVDSNEKYKINQEDLIKFGLIPEFVGRISSFIQMNDLDLEDYKKIILTSNLSLLLFTIKLYKTLGVEVLYDEEFINFVAEKVAKLNLGARGIKIVLTEIFEALETEVYAGQIKTVRLSKNEITRIRKKD